MKIAINTRFLLSDLLEGYGYFLYETLSRITKNHPQDEFLFIFDRPFDKKFLFAPNVRAEVVGPPARHPLLWKLWYDIRVPALLKKFKADVFLSPDGYCSLATRVPQCLVIHDLAFLHYPSFNKRIHVIYNKRYMPKFINKAAVIATVSDFSKNDILTHYPQAAGKIKIVYSAARELFQPSDSQEKSRIKNKYTEGKEFFLYSGAIHPRKNMVQLLKAFSIFKKRQQSNMKLVLAGRLAWKSESFTSKLESFKYRDDVVMTGYLEEKELASVIAAAYGMIYPSLWEGFGVPVLESMLCGTPVITSSKSSMEEIAGGAALLADPKDPADIAAQMMHLYKDESMRKELIQKGFENAKRYSWDKTAALLWDAILAAQKMPIANN
jgi:glycosyltransferase involved in cell wall biosynthesis